MERVYIDLGRGGIISGHIVRRYSWGALVQCGYQYFKVSDNYIFKTLQEAKESARKLRMKDSKGDANA